MNSTTFGAYTRDAWFIGYTSHLVTGVWLGNDDSSPTKKATGGGMPVEIWSRVMKAGHRGLAVAALPGVPNGPLAAFFPQSGAPMPPASVGRRVAPQQRQETNTGLDGWLIDRLFGRR